jgi:futalosine hydrolase
VRVLIVSATRAEVAPLVGALGSPHERERFIIGDIGAHRVHVLATGIGMVSTAVWCTRAFAAAQYDVALDLGVCGSFNPEFGPGAVVHVVRDRLAELGFEDGMAFRTFAEIGLCDPEPHPFAAGEVVNEQVPPLSGLAALPAVSAITVNTVHGDPASIAAVVERCRPDVESMEGAAFMYASRVAGVQFAQVRAVSNRVERRNRAAWDLPGAIAALNRMTLSLLDADRPEVVR